MTRMKRWAMTTVLAVVLVGSVADLATAQDQPKSLYDRLGGVYSIATVVDDFIERLLVNHQQLNITEGQWQAMVVDFQGTLDKLKVPAREQEELIIMVGSTKKDIVTPATSAP